MNLAPMTFVAALAAGFLGSGHCLGMCGGIAGALQLGPETGRTRRAALATLQNLGRILSYMLAGALVGAIGGGIGHAGGWHWWPQMLRIATAAVMILIGLTLATRWRGFSALERWGAHFWSKLAPLARRLLPARTPAQALAAGMLWGWLPCGLVYTLLAAAAVSGGAIAGAGVMLGFGLGTLPAMLGAGLAAGALTRKPYMGTLRRLAGVLLIVFGVWTVAMPVSSLFAPPMHMAAPAATQTSR
jgi:sulfite exporter TauE/SafE